ncbi:MAG TPA: ferritin-like domain-containing protein [Chitinophagaceae bacterium]|nr:ferritin-like domain-containing protein [Chitinophagaceae bacterium]
MQTTKTSNEEVALTDERIVQPFSRRKFLGYVGATSAILATAASCKKDPVSSNTGVDLGSGDVGILNYAYALEQLEAAFYMQVVATPYSGMSALEMEYLTDIRNHEVAHREFFKAAITAAAPSSIIPALSVNFSSIDFASRTSVLSTAKAFEDLGVTAYNGAGQLISTSGNGPTYLTLAGKIVSVEARHAALIADLISNGTFADTTDGNGLDAARTPAEVLAIAGTYITTKINASNLPS